MSCKRLTRVIILLLTFFPTYLKQDMAIGQPVLPEAKSDAASLEPRQAASLIEPVRLNPFLSFEEERNFLAPKEPLRVILDYFNLSAIFYSQEKTENKAIINGIICKVGDEIDVINSKKIVQIQPKVVILKDINGLEYLLMLNKGSEK